MGNAALGPSACPSSLFREPFGSSPDADLGAEEGEQRVIPPRRRESLRRRRRLPYFSRGAGISSATERQPRGPKGEASFAPTPAPPCLIWHLPGGRPPLQPPLGALRRLLRARLGFTQATARRQPDPWRFSRFLPSPSSSSELLRQGREGRGEETRKRACVARDGAPKLPVRFGRAGEPGRLFRTSWEVLCLAEAPLLLSPQAGQMWRSPRWERQRWHWWESLFPRGGASRSLLGGGGRWEASLNGAARRRRRRRKRFRKFSALG